MNLSDALDGGANNQSAGLWPNPSSGGTNPAWPGAPPGGAGPGGWPAQTGTSGGWPAPQGGGSGGWPSPAPQSGGGGSWGSGGQSVPQSGGGSSGGPGGWPTPQGGSSGGWPAPAPQSGGGGPGGPGVWPTPQTGGGGQGGSGGWPAPGGGGPGGSGSWPAPQSGGGPSPSQGTGPKTTSLAVPFNQSFPQGLRSGTNISISGTIKANANKFIVDLGSSRDLAFHFNPRFNEYGKKVVVRNNRIGDKWGAEERHLDGRFPFAAGQSFQMRIQCTDQMFKVFVDSNPPLEFKNRGTPLGNINKLTIYDDVTLSQVNIN
ncbi:galectin-3b isoform X2 [Nerophis ophidion]|uniref:galectin-3b isoform X2 n=1 Tax=Nerophis ophidion TaxID=159077 RepID=UPI002AE0A172|nr:galectin-3b isoform X2 [Nerophis ophidion]